MKSVGYAIVAAAVLAVLGTGGAQAAPSSVQREGGPCYSHELGKDSADGKLFCSGLTGTWQSRALTRAPKVKLGTPCPQLGARAYVYQTDGIATCRETRSGLRWQW